MLEESVENDEEAGALGIDVEEAPGCCCCCSTVPLLLLDDVAAVTVDGAEEEDDREDEDEGERVACAFRLRFGPLPRGCPAEGGKKDGLFSIVALSGVLAVWVWFLQRCYVWWCKCGWGAGRPR